MTAACRHHTAFCVVLPARAYRVWPTGTGVVLCEACAAELRSMGLALEDERPEWRRRLQARDETGAILAETRR